MACASPINPPSAIGCYRMQGSKSNVPTSLTISCTLVNNLTHARVLQGLPSKMPQRNRYKIHVSALISQKNLHDPHLSEAPMKAIGCKIQGPTYSIMVTGNTSLHSVILLSHLSTLSSSPNLTTLCPFLEVRHARILPVTPFKAPNTQMQEKQFDHRCKRKAIKCLRRSHQTVTSRSTHAIITLSPSVFTK